ncbi:TIGR02117 family protein [Dysgonomonas sp. 216]|uniref:TIGR02117 family protein n=1 Tax=Dysgonomonas sp. 216 TaxID=2302934 RepID=UPI0013D1510B|nr:TIGR02117 family protein [Dysgonomonas sp. 216]NDW17488.1 TIGR02117 family protein [Dysgonomonas sp. 216]
MFKRILKALKRISIGIIVFIVLYFVVGFCCSYIVVSEEEGTLKEIAIFIKTNGKHTDIVVPVCNEVMDWSKQIPFRNNISQDTVYSFLALGWGDKGFFLDMPTWDDLTFGLAFRAAFWLNSTAMHATYYKEMAEDEDCRKIMISKQQYQRLIVFITGRFEKDANGDFVNIKTNAVYGVSDAFYEAKGRYSLFYSCNTWANDALAACGQKHCLWTFFQEPIFSIYK